MNPVPREERWNALRSVEPPPGMKARGLARLTAELEPSLRKRRALVPVLVAIGVLVAGTSLAAVGVQAWRASQAREERAEPPQKGGAQPRPARASPNTLPEAPAHSSDGTGASGRAEPIAPDRALPTGGIPARPSAGVSTPKGLVEAPPSARGAEAAGAKHGAMDDSLSEQVATYKKIAGMPDREAALGEWRAMLKRWPRTTLRHEIELNIVDALARLGRRDEARGAASAFLKHFPASPRAGDMKKLLAGDAAKQ